MKPFSFRGVTMFDEEPTKKGLAELEIALDLQATKRTTLRTRICLVASSGLTFGLSHGSGMRPPYASPCFPLGG